VIEAIDNIVGPETEGKGRDPKIETDDPVDVIEVARIDPS